MIGIEPGVAIHGNVRLGEGVSIAAPAELNGNLSEIVIGSGCDIAAFVVLNCADSSDRCLGIAGEIRRRPIVIGRNVFIGSHVFVGHGVTVGDHCKIAAGTILVARRADPWPKIPPYSLVHGNPWRIKYGVYEEAARRVVR